jgi:hypothetical protein
MKSNKTASEKKTNKKQDDAKYDQNVTEKSQTLCCWI